MKMQNRVFLVAARLKDGGQKFTFFGSRIEAKREQDRLNSLGAVMTVVAQLRGANAQPAR